MFRFERVSYRPPNELAADDALDHEDRDRRGDRRFRRQPELLDSMYSVEQIIPKKGAVPVMILVVSSNGTHLAVSDTACREVVSPSRGCSSCVQHRERNAHARYYCAQSLIT
jgi:hypothetical protein